jgi:hypothetical protein
LWERAARDIGNVRALRVVCTVPTDLIADEALRFWPPLPRKVAAAAALPLGHAEKAMLYVDNFEMLPVDGHLFGATNRAQTGSYDLRPLGWPCIQAFFGISHSASLALNAPPVLFFDSGTHIEDKPPMPKKPGTNPKGEFAFFNVVYEDGSQRSNSWNNRSCECLSHLESPSLWGRRTQQAMMQEQSRQPTVSGRSSLPGAPYQHSRERLRT